MVGNHLKRLVTMPSCGARPSIVAKVRDDFAANTDVTKKLAPRTSLLGWTTDYHPVDAKHLLAQKAKSRGVGPCSLCVEVTRMENANARNIERWPTIHYNECRPAKRSERTGCRPPQPAPGYKNRREVADCRQQGCFDGKRYKMTRTEVEYRAYRCACHHYREKPGVQACGFKGTAPEDEPI